MSDSEARLSIREISRRIDVPESTLRYYRNTFGQYIPTVGSGRNRRHPEQAVDVYKTISRLFAAGESRETIRSRLEAARQGPEGGPIEWSDVQRPPPGQLNLDIADIEPVEVVSGRGSLRAREIEQLISALMMRDRELTQMHRELLEVLTRLIEVMESRIVAVGPADRALETASGTTPAGESEALEEQLEEIDSLRESLAQEQETVERLRRAKLELEQRLIRLERER